MIFYIALFDNTSNDSLLFLGHSNKETAHIQFFKYTQLQWGLNDAPFSIYINMYQQPHLHWIGKNKNFDKLISLQRCCYIFLS